MNKASFWVRVDKSGEPPTHVAGLDGCWLWTGTLDAYGYGRVGARDAEEQRAHRMSWRLTRGAVPDGLWVLHRCDNRRCVNPGHLFLGTNADNVHDMVSKGRDAGKLTAQDRDCIRKLHATGVFSNGELGRAFGVSKASVRKTVHGRNGKTRKRVGADHPHAKLSDDAVATLVAEYRSGGVTRAELAAKYGVSKSMVDNAIDGTGRFAKRIGVAVAAFTALLVLAPARPTFAEQTAITPRQLSRVLNAIAHVESRNNRHAVSPRGARGPMQIMPAVAAWCRVDPLDRAQSRRCAARLLRLHLQRFDGSLDHALAAYVFGAGNVARYERLRLPWPRRVEAYVQRVRARAGLPARGEAMLVSTTMKGAR